MNADGSGRKRVTPAESTTPVWAPSQKIVFYLDRDIWVVNPDGSGREMAIKGEGEEYGFEIAPDGRTLVFAYLAGPRNADLSVGKISGGSVRRLTETKEDECCPSWSPDGRSLAFMRAGDIYAINADGTGERNLTDSPEDESWPVWSPRG
jgi:Tol biopolymer transport system component